MDDRKQRDRQFHQRTAHLYHSTVVDPRDAGNRALFGPALKALRALSRAPLRMLELGAGTGHMALRLRQLCGDITLVDHSPAMLDEARRRLHPAMPERTVKFCEADVGEWSSNAVAAGQRFDLVVTVGVLHHLDASEIRALAGNVRALTADDGLWLLAEPVRTDAAEPALLARWNARYRRGFQLPWVGEEEPDEGPLDPQMLQDVLRNAGFVPVVERRGWEIFPRWGALHSLAAPVLDHLDRRSGPVHCGLYR